MEHVWTSLHHQNLVIDGLHGSSFLLRDRIGSYRGCGDGSRNGIAGFDVCFVACYGCACVNVLGVEVAETYRTVHHVSNLARTGDYRGQGKANHSASSDSVCVLRRSLNSVTPASCVSACWIDLGKERVGRLGLFLVNRWCRLVHHPHHLAHLPEHMR